MDPLDPDLALDVSFDPRSADGRRAADAAARSRPQKPARGRAVMSELAGALQRMHVPLSPRRGEER